MATIVDKTGSSVVPSVPSVPSDDRPVYKTHREVSAALAAGKLTPEDATEILEALLDSAIRKAWSGARAKSGPCTMSRADFLAKAVPFAVVVQGKELTARPTKKSAESGNSLGYWAGGQLTIDVGGQSLNCTVNVNVTVNHSADC